MTVQQAVIMYVCPDDHRSFPRQRTEVHVPTNIDHFRGNVPNGREVPYGIGTNTLLYCGAFGAYKFASLLYYDNNIIIIIHIVAARRLPVQHRRIIGGSYCESSPRRASFVECGCPHSQLIRTSLLLLLYCSLIPISTHLCRRCFPRTLDI